MVIGKIARVVGWSMIAAGSAWAYGPCDEDVEKICQKEFHQETEQTCLHENIEKLSKDCRSFVESRHEQWQKRNQSFEKVRNACKADIDKRCPEAWKSRKPAQVCIMMHSEEISQTCKSEMNRHINAWLSGIKEMK